MSYFLVDLYSMVLLLYMRGGGGSLLSVSHFISVLVRVPSCTELYAVLHKIYNRCDIPVATSSFISSLPLHLVCLTCL